VTLITCHLFIDRLSKQADLGGKIGNWCQTLNHCHAVMFCRMNLEPKLSREEQVRTAAVWI